MLLENKTAIIYGAAGSVGSAMAMAFSIEGARVFLTGKKLEPLSRIAEKINAAGGVATAHVVDALSKAEIENHLQEITSAGHSVDICFNATGTEVVQNVPLTTLTVDEFTSPVQFAMQTHFLTATAVAKIMMQQGNGVIITFTATPGGIGYPYTGGFAPACAAIECFSKNLAAELGVYGVRVVNIRSGGSPDSRVFKEAIENHPVEMKPILEKMKSDSMLKRLPLLKDITNTAVFLASAMASSITGVTVDVTCGTTAGLNYRVENSALKGE